jgi:thiol-disulfide isomerase/thioredoxin
MPALRQAFKESSLSSFEGETDVVAIDFGATWCSPCERQRPIFERVAGWFDREQPEASVVFVTVDVDENETLPEQFTVRSVPTTIIARYEDALLWGKRWREKKRFQGVIPFETLRSAVADVVAGDE